MNSPCAEADATTAAAAREGFFSLARSRSPGLTWARALVAAGWFTVALCGLLYLSQHLNVTWHSSYGINAWVSANRYPKQKELICFVAAVAGVPSVMVFGWLLWTAFAGGLSRILRTSQSVLLWQVAALHLALLAAWPRLRQLDPDAWQAAAKGLLWYALPALVLMIGWNLWQSRRKKPLPTSDGASQLCGGLTSSSAVDGGRGQPPAIDSNRQIDSAEPTPRRRWWRWLRLTGLWLGRAIALVVVPVMIYAMNYPPPGIDGGADLFHESEFMVPMDAMMHGAVPYRDVYLQHGLFHNAWIPWLGGKLFGPTLAGVRHMRNLVAPALVVAVYFMVLATFRFGLVSAMAAAVVFLAAGVGPAGRATFPFLAVAMLASALHGPRAFVILSPDGDINDAFPGWKALWRICLRHGWRIATAGFLAMLGFWHSVETGLYALAAGGLFTIAVGLCQGCEVRWWRRALPAGCFGIGAFIGFWIIGWHFLIHGALDDLARNIWAQCAYQIETWGLPFPQGFTAALRPLLAHPGQTNAWQMFLGSHPLQWYSGPIVLTLAAVALAWRATGTGFWRSRWAPQLLLLTLTGIFFFRTVLGRSDGAHLHYGIFFATLLLMFPTAALAGKAWDILIGAEKRRRPDAKPPLGTPTVCRLDLRSSQTGTGIDAGWKPAFPLMASPGIWSRRLRGVSVLLLAVAVGWGYAKYVQVRWHPIQNLTWCWQRLRQPPPATSAKTEPIARAGILDLGGQQIHLQPVIAYIQANSQPDEPVFDYSNQALWLFFADRRSATRYFNVAYASHPAMQQTLIDELERNSPSLVIYSSRTYFDRIDGVPQASRHPLVDEYVKRHFITDRNVGNVQFWKRKAAPTPAQAAP